MNCPDAGTAFEILRACNFTALMFVTRNPSTAGISAEAFNCRILLAAVPTSTFRVPFEVIGPPVNPVPAATLVTVPLVIVVGSHCALDVFHPTTWPAPGTDVAIVRVPIFAAFTLETRDPSTAGINADPFPCPPWFADVPKSTEIVPFEVTGPPSNPKPVATLVTEPLLPDVGSHCAVELFQPMN